MRTSQQCKEGWATTGEGGFRGACQRFFLPFLSFAPGALPLAVTVLLGADGTAPSAAGACGGCGACPSFGPLPCLFGCLGTSSATASMSALPARSRTVLSCCFGRQGSGKRCTPATQTLAAGVGSPGGRWISLWWSVRRLAASAECLASTICKRPQSTTCSCWGAS